MRQISACRFGMIERRNYPDSARRVSFRHRAASARLYFDGAFRASDLSARHVEPEPDRGPAIVEEFAPTTVVVPGQHLKVDPPGHSHSSAAKIPAKSKAVPLNVTSSNAKTRHWDATAAPAARSIRCACRSSRESSIPSKPIELAIERPAFAVMREAQDYRVGLFEYVTDASSPAVAYSAMPNAVVRDFPTRPAAGRYYSDETTPTSSEEPSAYMTDV